ncbi:helix-turn-helix domain-containing protein [Sphingobacterium hotanense]|uniref:helix-turn-helix domain-containing protein n=1 Tax=Sphingobacterium hotanense TaxID=649196 RepID=UPI0021A7A99B|nr:AraC family transcriptional regulator [Sphingobacterium hotanense]MCT1525039.1 AraC family transcriptional regulator [Sphingobacterium hotanense]
MRRTVTYQFRSHALVTDITGNIPGWCRDRLAYGQAERIDIKEGTIISQYYSHFLFFIEVIDVDLQTDLIADYTVLETSLFLFMMQEGKIAFEVPGVGRVAGASGNTCYATYNSRGEFTYRLPAGRHRFYYIVPRTGWVAKNIGHFPRLEPFLERMQKADDLFGHMPACRIDEGMHVRLGKLFGLREGKGNDLESLMLRDVKRIIVYYHQLLDAMLGQRPYLIRSYIEENYADPLLGNRMLMEVFHVSESTLIGIFRNEFGTTPNTYLISFRMQRAKILLAEGKISATEVAHLVGYGNFRSFSIQFKKLYGFPPSQCC